MRAESIDPGVKLSVAGSKISAVAVCEQNTVLQNDVPPMTRTLPSSRRTALCPKREVAMVAL